MVSDFFILSRQATAIVSPDKANPSRSRYNTVFSKTVSDKKTLLRIDFKV